MTTTTVRTKSDVRAWLSLSRAAVMLGVNKATLSRRADLALMPVGQQEKRISPTAVMRLAREYRRRVVDEVGYDLVEHARHVAPDQLAAVELEVDDVMRERPGAANEDLQGFLRMAESNLPPDLYRLVSDAVKRGGASPGVLADPSPTETSAPAHPAPGRRSPKAQRSAKRAASSKRVPVSEPVPV